ncbi:helix-turn-helix transcriptional regulator [Kitasatospora sp. NBC_01266]|uniref:helix-turn-helix transcriptional regulator n=1 Tax=Kitasatospora sp. NBC_01266 TaxID=2903572 RepID=UPI002E2FE970|nr:helix-turn-helix transcriptional regulator [Kitasatospora sp. NBC_01266]
MRIRREVGDRIRRMRRDRHLSQEKLAEMTGVDRQTIGFYELGRTSPTLDQLVAISRALGVPLVNLLWS